MADDFDIGGGDVSGDFGSSDINADTGSDFDGDLASDNGAELSSDFNADVGDDLGQDLNNSDIGEGSNDDFETDTLDDAEIDTDVGDDLNADLGKNSNGDIPIDDEFYDNTGENLNEMNSDDIPEIEAATIANDDNLNGDFSEIDNNFEADSSENTESDAFAFNDAEMELGEENTDAPDVGTEESVDNNIHEGLNDESVIEPEILDNSEEISDNSIGDTQGAEPESLEQFEDNASFDSNAQETETTEQSEKNEPLDNVKSTKTEAIEKPIDSEESPLNAMSAYMNEHNYGKEDYAEYSKDPQWQELNSNLGGVNPVEAIESSDAASENSTPESTDNTKTTPLDNVRETDYDTTGMDVDEPFDNSINEVLNEDSPVLTKDQTEQWISGNNAIDNTIEAMRDDLRDKGLTDEAQIENIVMGERAELQEELTRNIEGDFSNPYQQPDFDDYASLDTDNASAKLSKLTNDFSDKGLVNNPDLRDFDTDVADAMKNAFEDAKKDFPNLDINYFGTIQNQVEGIKESLAKNYEKGFREKWGGAYSDDDYKTAAITKAKQDVAEFGLNDFNDAFAWSLNIPEGSDPTGGDLSRYNGIAVNSKYASNNDNFTASKINEVAIKHKPIGCDTPRATADHELGHEIDKLLDAHNDLQIKELYDTMMKDGNAEDVLSAYSAKNIKEFIAEGYSEYRNNPEPRDYAKSVFSRLIAINDLRRIGNNG